MNHKIITTLIISLACIPITWAATTGAELQLQHTQARETATTRAQLGAGEDLNSPVAPISPTSRLQADNRLQQAERSAQNTINVQKNTEAVRAATAADLKASTAEVRRPLVRP